jgi:DNA-binding NtrC family response regulator
MQTANHINVLVVDDDHEFREMMLRRFSQDGFLVQEAATAERALELLTQKEFDVIILDMVLPNISGVDLLQRFSDMHVESEVIFLTGQATVESAVEAMKLGAYDYVQKPFPLKELEVLIEKAAERRRLSKENSQLRALLERSKPSGTKMIGQSPAMQEVFRLIERAGPSDRAILIQGESGTGKELVARALHAHSTRADKPLVVINCAALPETLLESELFGHEKGAFTGAVSHKQGLFEVADGGTMFIDEIGEMPGSLQAKLLRVLEDGSMRRIGSVKERRVNVRLLAATNRRLEDEVAAGRFREDLYYRINVMSLELPPLRQRAGDIPLLVQCFLGPQWKIDADAEAALQNYAWPGNVRQLINALERAKIMAENQMIHRYDLPREISQISGQSQPLTPLNCDDLSAMERNKVVEIMRREGGNKARSARTLGIDRRKLYRLIEKYSIQEIEVNMKRS